MIDWVNGVLEQKRGRAPQLTPMMPMPIRGLPRGVAESLDMATARPVVDFTWTLQNIVWTRRVPAQSFSCCSRLARVEDRLAVDPDVRKL